MIKLLQEKAIIPIARAEMRIRIRVSGSKELKKVKEKIQAAMSNIEEEENDGQSYEVVSSSNQFL